MNAEQGSADKLGLDPPMVPSEPKGHGTLDDQQPAGQQIAPNAPPEPAAAALWRPDYDRFVATEREPLRRFVTAVARRRELAQTGWDVDDIVQEVLLTAYTWWTRVDDDTRRGWLRTVALNAVWQAQRTEIRHRLTGALAPPGWTSTAAHRPVEYTVATRLAAGEALEAIGNLPEVQRAVVHLHHVDGYSRAEIADLLGISPNTVGTHLTRGSRRLRERLAHWADTAKALALAAVVGTATYLATQALARVYLPLPAELIDPQMRDLLLSALASLAATYRGWVIEAIRTWRSGRRRRDPGDDRGRTQQARSHSRRPGRRSRR